MTKIYWRFLSWLAWALLVCATASTFYTSSAAQLPKWPKIDPFPKIADAALTKYINANQPIDYNYGELFPQVALPGTAFVPSNAAQVAAESAQLAQSANGEIDLAPGDYALPVRLYCTHIYTGTAPGLNYLLAQLNGKRAHVITMLTARVGNKGLPYKPVQVLSWAIQNGQKYGDLTPTSRALVDGVIPDQRAALGDDLVEQIRAYWNDYVRGHRGMPDFDTELHRLPAGDQILKYERAKNAMSQHPDDYDALRNEFILEGQAPAAQGSAPPWSQVRPGVLERLIPPEGRWIGGVGTLQIRVLPTSAPTVAVPVTDIIGYPPNSMQPVTFSIVDLPGNAPEKGSSAPAATGSSAPAATGCGGRPFSGQLRLSVTGFDSSTGKIAINGVDVRRPGTPFTWNWGDGTTTQGWFPQSYTYAEPHGDYTIQVISHEDAGTSDCAQLTVKFPSAENAAPPITSTSATNDAQQRSLFSSDRALDTERWQASTPLLAALAKKEGLRWVEPKLSFDQSGMTMSGVNGTYQITGLQSKESFTPPFKVRASVMGTIANGVPFALYIVSDDLHQSLRAEGNLNPHNGPYYGMSITPEKGQGAKVSRDVSVKRWYTVEFAVDANGLGTATVSDSQGTNVLSKADMPIGLGPFFILLVQREGAPYTVGANEAVWSSVELSPSAVSTASGSAITPSAQPAVISEQQQVARVPAGAAKQDIRSIDFQNFSYESKCLDENAPANLIHVSKGQANNQDGQFWMDKPAYGDFKGDGHELAAVALGCHPADMSPNVNFSEVFIFQMSGSEPKLLATLPPSFWKERRVTGLKVSNQQLAVDFLEMGDRGSNACPEWIVTSKLHWDGNRFVTASESRRKNSCAQ